MRNCWSWPPRACRSAIRGRRLVDLPEPYVVWFAGQGFPPGKLGDMLRTVYEIKVNGLEFILTGCGEMV